MRILHATAFLLLLAPHAFSQAPTPPPGAILSHPNQPQPRTADVDSVTHILAALYDVISGPARQPRDWNRMRSLFIPDARLIPTRIVPGTPDPHTSPSTDVQFLSIDDYVERSNSRTQTDGFFEHSIHNEVAEFGNIVHVFSTYESRHAVADAKPFARGINSIQLLKDGGRYWIVDVFWDAESPDHPIPQQYLPSAGSAASALNQNLTGEWTGQVEYRDFQSNERVFLPTWLTMTPSSDGRAVTLAYLYDDGPAKTVREQSTLTFAGLNASLVSDQDKTSDAYTVTGLEEFQKLNRGTLTLIGAGKENGKPVDTRITLTLQRNLFTFVKETRLEGTEEFKFRDAYTLTRTSPPPA